MTEVVGLNHQTGDPMDPQMEGINHQTGDPMDPQMEGIFDNYSVKSQIINSG